mmetsp:Transcript_15082/g.38759  ORF Transcript_15082/g.38759 Transcript_15082/m.38759 type:complete len:263 (+) Transcript_15082:290-1078(+)|eukprot:CAMPEP_0182915890 /NCGR_PEP_ID=MMETSP0105_2-20130417/602_1 /TAXON_ID=81532 ORGANISM="Acanthoeca-like sp., Strain 10tr" /NCGR_SAMPLE_ID=MMETSP0105_2 /ASSEMBLY_ACC=CAM_ASM_000205 /LENGTH=262 /DNA_ID=CAMNT_0025052789 /DNA_START=268 /DNA_END=1056 /DNA_ORIENTATION=-
MKIIPSLEAADKVEDVEQLLLNLRDLIAENGGGDGADAEIDGGAEAAAAPAARGRARVPQRGRPLRSSTPQGGVSSSREESVQRRKAEGSRPGSRRDRRWMNRVALLPTIEDLQMDAMPIPSRPSPFTQLRSMNEVVVDAWESDNLSVASLRHGAELSPTHHPRVERRFLSLLRRAPAGAVASIEQDLIDTFSEDASSVYIVKSDRWARAILHAVCGYLGLTSSSETADGERITTVTNPRAKFSPPLRRLSTVDQMNEGSDL